MGARLDRVRVRTNGRRIAAFLITGKDLDRLGPFRDVVD
jgi:hypothetical protein